MIDEEETQIDNDIPTMKQLLNEQINQLRELNAALEDKLRISKHYNKLLLTKISIYNSFMKSIKELFKHLTSAIKSEWVEYRIHNFCDKWVELMELK